MLKIENVRIYEDLDRKALFEKALKKGKVRKNDVRSMKVIKKAIDARDKKNVHYLYSFAIDCINEDRYPYLKRYTPSERIETEVRRNSEYRPIIVGMGPAGLFCALTLIENGIKPILIEQGDCVEKRVKKVEEYRTKGILNPLSNVQFGEGGAGTFSDGKLTTGINSPYVQFVMDTFHRFGAPEEITYLSHPHIGTDNLRNILKNIRQYIQEKGGEYYFNTRMEAIEKDNGIIRVICSDKCFETDCVVLAIGHSARKTFEMLYEKGLEMKRKNFSVGVRMEHLQETINEAQYGTETELDLPAAEYKLVYHDGDRVCYSFCMCPGGEVMASASEEGHIVTNGMSNYARNGKNANAAILVNVLKEDIEGDDPLAGIYYQEELERKAFEMAGSNNSAPVQRYEDFVNNHVTRKLGRVKPTYKPGYTFCDLNELLPEYVSDTMKKGISYFGTKIKGFDDPDSILTGVETRTSSPVTIVRDETLQSNIKGLYPCGEGAGYAGGITSAAVDGIKTALKILENE